MWALIGICIFVYLLSIWACMKAGSDEDDRMGYDDVVE